MCSKVTTVVYFLLIDFVCVCVCVCVCVRARARARARERETITAILFVALVRPRLHWYSKWVSYLYH